MAAKVTASARNGMSQLAEIHKPVGTARNSAEPVDEILDGMTLPTTGHVVARARALATQYDAVEGAAVDDFVANRVIESGQ